MGRPAAVVLSARAGSRRGRRGHPVLQEPVLGATDSERRNCPGIRRVRFEVPASMSAAAATRLTQRLRLRWSPEPRLSRHDPPDSRGPPGRLARGPAIRLTAPRRETVLVSGVVNGQMSHPLLRMRWRDRTVIDRWLGGRARPRGPRGDGRPAGPTPTRWTSAASRLSNAGGHAGARTRRAHQKGASSAANSTRPSTAAAARLQGHGPIRSNSVWTGGGWRRNM